MRGIPRLPAVDSTAQLLRDPYRFISARARRLRSDVFETRILLGKTICMTGKDAAALFTDEALFQRRGAPPGAVGATLFGKGGIQGLDGEAYVHRKRLFVAFLTGGALTELPAGLRELLDEAAGAWAGREKVVLYGEFQELLTKLACRWTGVPLPAAAVRRRTRELTALFDSAGGPGHLAARIARLRSEAWIERLVVAIHAGQREDLLGTPIHVMALARDHRGELLPPRIAAVEALNLLRPIVAVSLYFVFCVHALHLHTESRQRLRAQEPGYLDLFVNEVRRFYPFFPALAARVRQDFRWGRFTFRRGTRVLLDLYGINHDPRLWERPGEFRPERFRPAAVGPFDFVPQGVGDHDLDHRCPGELVTVELMRAMVEYFVQRLRYEVPPQELRVALDRVPALPADRMVIARVSRVTPFLTAYA
jgi:fatty-acid peroxygenase